MFVKKLVDKEALEKFYVAFLKVSARKLKQVPYIKY